MQLTQMKMMRKEKQHYSRFTNYKFMHSHASYTTNNVFVGYKVSADDKWTSMRCEEKQAISKWYKDNNNRVAKQCAQ